MKKHSGMRPQDIAVLLKIIALEQADFYLKDISQALSISASEVSESANRSVLAGLLADDKKTVMRKALFEFLVHGLPYVFPQRPGAVVAGIPTAHAAPPLRKHFPREDPFVWPDPKGKIKGQQIEPYFSAQVKAVKNDPAFYELLALSDALRVGRAREKKLAEEALKARILG